MVPTGAIFNGTMYAGTGTANTASCMVARTWISIDCTDFPERKPPQDTEMEKQLEFKRRFKQNRKNWKVK